jgi:hypothetical protein
MHSYYLRCEIRNLEIENQQIYSNLNDTDHRN